MIDVNFLVLEHNNQINKQIKELCLIYQPLVGDKAISILLTLSVLKPNILHKISFLSDLTSISKSAITSEIKKLEALGLIKTYYNDNIGYAYELREANTSWFNDLVLNDILNSKVSKSTLNEIQRETISKISLEGYEEVTSSLNEVFPSSINSTLLPSSKGLLENVYIDFINKIPSNANYKNFVLIEENKNKLLRLIYANSLSSDQLCLYYNELNKINNFSFSSLIDLISKEENTNEETFIDIKELDKIDSTIVLNIEQILNAKVPLAFHQIVRRITNTLLNMDKYKELDSQVILFIVLTLCDYEGQKVHDEDNVYGSIFNIKYFEAVIDNYLENNATSIELIQQIRKIKSKKSKPSKVKKTRETISLSDQEELEKLLNNFENEGSEE
jgi:DNA-binding Lrp family transcriptional regulator